MKLVAVLFAGLLALPHLARAEDLTPPGGPVYVDAEADVDVDADVDVQTANWQPGRGGPPGQQRGEQQRHKNRALKQALMAHFDANGDGRLGPRERMRAARVLGKISRKLAMRGQQGKQGRQGRQQGQVRERVIKRFDTNGDGQVDRSEMPPGAGRKLRRFDRDRDGWVEPGELR